MYALIAPKYHLTEPYEGPFKILNRNSDSVFRIIFKGQPADISIDRLKPAFLENIPEDNQNLTEKQKASESTLKPTPILGANDPLLSRADQRLTCSRGSIWLWQHETANQRTTVKST